MKKYLLSLFVSWVGLASAQTTQAQINIRKDSLGQGPRSDAKFVKSIDITYSKDTNDLKKLSPEKRIREWRQARVLSIVTQDDATLAVRYMDLDDPDRLKVLKEMTYVGGDTGITTSNAKIFDTVFKANAVFVLGSNALIFGKDMHIFLEKSPFSYAGHVSQMAPAWVDVIDDPYKTQNQDNQVKPGDLLAVGLAAKEAIHIIVTPARDTLALVHITDSTEANGRLEIDQNGIKVHNSTGLQLYNFQQSGTEKTHTKPATIHYSMERYDPYRHGKVTNWVVRTPANSQ
jgi:hypothetical protein